VLEALERLQGPGALSTLTEKVPRRLLSHASLDRLRQSATLDTILLDDGEELLLFIDSLLGDGSGRVLEAVGQELAARALNQGGVAKFGDLHGTVARLQAFLDHPFVDTPTVFELRRSDLGFSLTVGVVGRPRATRVLRHLAVGAVNAAERTAREGGVRLSTELLADRATLNVRYQRASEPPPRLGSEPPPTSVRRPAPSVRPPSLSAEVERILSSHKSRPPRSSTPAPASSSRNSRSSEPPPATERTSEVQRTARAVERTSEVQKVAPVSGAPDAALDPPSATSNARLRGKG
jgi:hypothetical protein